MKVRALVLALMLVAAPAVAQPPKPANPDGFVPVDTPINAQDTIPAPRLVAIAYGFIWVVLFGYIWTVRSRLSSVEREMQTVSKRIGSGGRPA
jgi:CcmD family protein